MVANTLKESQQRLKIQLPLHNLQRNEKLVRSYSFSFESDKIYNMPYALPYSLAIDSHYLDNW
ncbi:MAG: hypothetical protein WBQ25_17810, partial [Nitrososphaeraceae archaeon]